MNRVFIIEHSSKEGIDVTSATTFGEIVYVFPRNERHASAFRHVEFGRAVVKRLRDADFNPERDYVCCTGSMVTIGVAFIALAKAFRVLRVLMFNSFDNVYVERRFDDNLFSDDVIGVTNECT